MPVEYYTVYKDKEGSEDYTACAAYGRNTFIFLRDICAISSL